MYKTQRVTQTFKMGAFGELEQNKDVTHIWHLSSTNYFILFKKIY